MARERRAKGGEPRTVCVVEAQDYRLCKEALRLVEAHQAAALSARVPVVTCGRLVRR